MRRSKSRQLEEYPAWTQPNPPLVCPICQHEYERRDLTRHHTIPKSRKGRETTLVCRPCHTQIHATFSEKELERSYGTIELLLSAAEFQPWIEWIRQRKPKSGIRVKSHKRRKR